MIKILERTAVEALLKRDVTVKSAFQSSLVLARFVSTVPDRVLESTRHSKLGKTIGSPAVEGPVQKGAETPFEAIRDYKYIYPEFLPNPVHYFRDKIREKLERQEMINRRKQILIPEFYVGSILAVTVSDLYAPGKSNRFVGICIRRDDYGLRHTFTLRNTIDGLGVEIMYDMYNPTIQKIEVLKLEKRIDENLQYLQDCPPEYSTIPFDFEPVRSVIGATVPVNPIKIPLNPKPWRHRWDRKHLKGVIYPEMKRYELEEYHRSHRDNRPHVRWDMMKHYRETIHDDDQREIAGDIRTYEQEAKLKDEVSAAAQKLVKARVIPKDSSAKPNRSK